MSNANNGLITKIWGPPMWTSLHCITFGYPINPTPEQKVYYREFFIRLGDVLPCKYCRESYKKFISTGVTELKDEVFESRASLTQWFYLLHEKVNKKLGITYGVTYDMVVDRYETFRASCSVKKDEKGCIMPLDEKARSYRIAEIKDAPLIPYEFAKLFEPYARKRGLTDSDLSVLNMCQQTPCIHAKIADIDCDQWCQRNDRCWEIINRMRKSGLPSTEPEGEWEGLPTLDEIKLIMMLSTSLCFDVLNEMIPKLPHSDQNKKRRIYVLTKSSTSK